MVFLPQKAVFLYNTNEMVNSPEKAPALSTNVETKAITVMQPKAIMSLLEDLNTFDALEQRVSETGGQKPTDMAAGGQGTQQDDHVSARELAIANLPDEAVMNADLQKHIQGEIKVLENKPKASEK